jgi:hypothetical protein
MTDPETRLTPHFRLREFTTSTTHPEIYNVPAPLHVENLTRVAQWLEVLREEYNRRYSDGTATIRISSGYRSYNLNRAVGGDKASNHLMGCAADVRCIGLEQAVRYAAILLDKMDEAHADFDEIIIERNLNIYWLHFAVRQSGNRRKVTMIVKR